MPEIVFEIDKDLNVTFLNQSCENILGYSKSEFINKKIPVNDIVIPSDLKRMQTLSRDFTKMKSDLANATMHKAEIEQRILKGKGEFEAMEAKILRKHGKDTVINLDTGELMSLKEMQEAQAAAAKKE